MANGFLAGVRPPPGRGAPPRFDADWEDGATYLDYLEATGGADANWTGSLEELHADASGEHFIDVQTRGAALAALRLGELAPGEAVVDLGCSSGHLLAELAAARGDVLPVGVDAVADGLPGARRRVPRAALFRASALDLPFAAGSAGALVALNVLEHIADDAAALRECARVLRPGGRLIVVVPRGPELYDAYDTALLHERRYARGELRRKLVGAGLRVEGGRHLGSLLYPGFWAVKKRNRLRLGHPTPERAGELVERAIASTEGSRLGSAASALEDRLAAAGVRPPFGIRELAVGVKP